MVNELEQSAFFNRPSTSKEEREKSQPKTTRLYSRLYNDDRKTDIAGEAIQTDNIRTVKPNDRTEHTNERLNRTVLHELREGVTEKERPTERYSFEIYTDQKQRIEDLQYRFKRRTGKKLSSSRIIREAIEEYLNKAEKAA